MASAFNVWLERILACGESVQTEPPPQTLPPAATALLQDAFQAFSLDVAGPVVAFHAEAAGRAALVLAHHCWAVANGFDTATGFDPGSEPIHAAEYLSSDLMLRYLPIVYRRTLSRSAGSELVAEQEKLLRSRPLSGVLADLDGEPIVPLTFDGHPGLMMLYAERLAAKPRAGWVPGDGAAREWVEQIFQERGQPLPVHIPKEAVGE